MKKITPVFLFACLMVNAQQDLKKNFIPLKSSGELPAAFTQDIRNVIKQDITELKNKHESNRGLKSTFLTASNYQIEKIIKSGNTLINDEITIYLNKLTDLILENNPKLRKQLHIFTLKSQVVNAYSYDKGYIFIDIGLIAQVETEAQLAYIICHEISHYTKQHHINSYIKNAEIDSKTYGYTREDRVVEKCQYSKENESEADLEGFVLFERTGYNLKQAEKAFDMLQYAHLPFELVEFKKSYFEGPNYVLPGNYFLKEVSAIRDNSHEDDTKQTHPNTAKRKLAIGEIIKSRDNSARVNSLLGQEKFEYIRDLARLELCKLYLKSRDYPNALYAAYIMSLKYPSNEYISEVITKCLYAITLYHKNEIIYNSSSYLENGIVSYTEIESYPQQLYHLISKMPENEWTIMSLNYVYRESKKHPDNKILSAFSDSLFNIMKRTRWGISNFTRVPKKDIAKKDSVVAPKEMSSEPSSKTDLIANLQKASASAVEDTVYYKDMFLDLFLNDKEFSGKFPATSFSESDDNESGFKTYSSRRAKEKKKSQTPAIDKMVLLEPFFVKIDQTQRQEMQYLLSDEKQEMFSKTVNNCAVKLGVELIVIDPGVLKPGEVDKINDYSIINDWFDEKFDTDMEKNRILNTEDIDKVIKKYSTPYFLRTGVVSIKTYTGRKRTYFYGFLFDLNSNKLVYRKYEFFNTKDRQDMINAKTYQILYELKYPKK
jgi:hypothetical protein